MISTRSQIQNTSIINEMREYFEKLMKPHVTNKKLEDLLKFFQDEITKSFEQKLKDEKTKIEDEINCYR